MIDFFSSQSSNQNSTLTLVIYTVLLSVVLSSALAYTYKKTNRDTTDNRHFMQAMILIAIVAAMVMQAIGDSLARGLGMLGALSIIRFRNTIRDPRNIVFIFAALAIGIACGVYGFYVATVGTLTFIITTTVLYFSPLSQSNNLIGTLTIQSPLDKLPDIEKILSQKCKRHKRIRFTIVSKKEGDTKLLPTEPVTTTSEDITLYSHQYQFRLKDNTDPVDLNNAIASQQDITLKKFDIKDTQESI